MPLPTRLATLLLACALAALAGCQPIKFATPGQEAAAQAWIAKVRARQFDVVTAALDPSLRTDATAEQLRLMADAFPPGPTTRTTLVGDNHVWSTQSGQLDNLSYEMQVGGQWIFANVATRTRDGSTVIVGLHVDRLAAPLEEQNRFSLADKPLSCYVVLALAILAPAVSILALVVCVRTPLRGRKWPWVLAILASVCTVTVNWTTGQWGFQLLMFQLLGIGFTKATYGPLMLSAALPVGALVFLVRRLDLRRPPAAPEPAPPTATA